MSSSNAEEGQVPKPGKGAPGLSEIATRAAIEHLKSVLPNANYCCGGSIPISTDSPVTIRFDNSSTSSIHKIQFPSSSTDINELLLASERATFGLDGKDVLDETYRKAAALATDKFSTNFHPADHGLVDALAQILLPDYRLRADGKKKELWGVKAELYKLNVYSGPSGKFKKHVDTPRGTLQFGSLVVCLPYEHQGSCLLFSVLLSLVYRGALLVTHRGHTNTFDWSSPLTTDSEASTSPAQIKWAAFYSDCTHEVQPVVSGHRVTLTYNLYVSPHSVGSLFTLPPPIDASSYPLSAGAREMLSQNGFMPEGGKLGFYCTHQYAHSTATKGRAYRGSHGGFTNRDTADIEHLMPYALKGVDAMIFQTFASLGLNVSVKPVLDMLIEEYWDDNADDVVDRIEASFEGETREQKLERIEKEAKYPRIGKRFWGFHFTNIEYGEGFEDPYDMTDTMWPSESESNLIWLNNPKTAGWQQAFLYLYHGNEPNADWTYSHATIVIDIPPRNERRVEIPESGFLVDGSKYEREPLGPPNMYGSYGDDSD
ncbi:Oxoglutarate iron-dependent dioxygenase protein [Rutstroemia sp. NJR-2017a WRK4]|nr:Oxoglutarate iron-dependent dioxygenase protein [Rutstroemia sp. NJR-2017a WRK4]